MDQIYLTNIHYHIKYQMPNYEIFRSDKVQKLVSTTLAKRASTIMYVNIYKTASSYFHDVLKG